MKKHVTEENVQTANKYVKRCSKSLAIREMQRDITTYLLVQLIISHIETTSNDGEDAEKRNHLGFVGGNVRWYSHSGKLFGH